MLRTRVSIQSFVRAIALTLVTPILFVSFQGTAFAQHMQATPVLKQYFNMVFAGDISGAKALFESAPADHGAVMLKDKFGGRFVARDNSLDLSAIDSPKVREIAQLFQAYWRDALTQVAPLDELETELKSRLDSMLGEHGFDSALDDEDKLLENVEEFIRREGFFALSGRTPPLLELMIWTTNEVVTHSVELTDGIYEVDVNYLDGFVSYGWSNFATFGMTSTGGWAKTDGLYCLCAHYDLDSEKFRLSFLKHEARHFADFALYPELQASDLEYRSKLTELAFSEEGTYSLLEHFQGAANKIDDAPHPLANWYVMNGLSQHLLDGELPGEADGWEAISKDEIRQTATLLLAEHDAALAGQGAETTKGVINL